MAQHLDFSSAASTPIPAIDPDDRLSDDFDTRDTGRSNFAAFLLGGVVIAGGLMAFLYYDNGQTNRSDDIVTGSIIRTPPLTAPNVQVPLVPRQPANGSTQP